MPGHLHQATAAFALGTSYIRPQDLSIVEVLTQQHHGVVRKIDIGALPFCVERREIVQDHALAAAVFIQVAGINADQDADILGWGIECLQPGAPAIPVIDVAIVEVFHSAVALFDKAGGTYRQHIRDHADGLGSAGGI